jgi:hypothetical protein
VEIMLDGIVNCCRAKLIEKFPPEADLVFPVSSGNWKRIKIILNNPVNPV